MAGVSTSKTSEAGPIGLSDEELTELALAADPNPVLGDDAVSLWDLAAPDDEHRLPTWYMPSPRVAARRLTGWRRRIAIGIVVAFLLIDAAGLCSTYGSIALA